MPEAYISIDRRPTLPVSAAWQHLHARAGFEVAFLDPPPHPRASGGTAAVEDDCAWVVGYDIAFDAGWVTRRATVTGRSVGGRREVQLEALEDGGWLIDGQRAPELDGCFDVDLESSCLTNAFPVRRLSLAIGQVADAPAAYVRAVDLRVERLEQRYTRLGDVESGQRYRYEAPAFQFECDLVYDGAGLVLDYPGIGRRVA
jgi:uncharacterized protein